MIIKEKDEHFEVEMHHMVCISKLHPYEAFKQYLKDIYSEFDTEITKSFMSLANIKQ